jgi:hypothetical protein
LENASHLDKTAFFWYSTCSAMSQKKGKKMEMLKVAPYYLITLVMLFAMLLALQKRMRQTHSTRRYQSIPINHSRIK